MTGKVEPAGRVFSAALFFEGSESHLSGKLQILYTPRTAFAGREVLKKSRHRECGFVRRPVDHREARRFFQMKVFNRLDHCPGDYRSDIVSLACLDVPVGEHEDVVDDGSVQFLGLEITLDDFVYLIDSNGRHSPSS
jgi:hypothetical protein